MDTSVDKTLDNQQLSPKKPIFNKVLETLLNPDHLRNRINTRIGMIPEYYYLTRGIASSRLTQLKGKAKPSPSLLGHVISTAQSSILSSPIRKNIESSAMAKQINKNVQIIKETIKDVQSKVQSSVLTKQITRNTQEIIRIFQSIQTTLQSHPHSQNIYQNIKPVLTFFENTKDKLERKLNHIQLNIQCYIYFLQIYKHVEPVPGFFAQVAGDLASYLIFPLSYNKGEDLITHRPISRKRLAEITMLISSTWANVANYYLIVGDRKSALLIAAINKPLFWGIQLLKTLFPAKVIAIPLPNKTKKVSTDESIQNE